MKRRDTREAKISFVNLVKYLTSVDPWKKATTREMTNVHIPIQNLHGR